MAYLFDEIIIIVEAVLRDGYDQSVNRRGEGWMYEDNVKEITLIDFRSVRLMLSVLKI